MAGPRPQNGGDAASSPAPAGPPLNFVGSLDTVFRQIKEYHDECGVGTVDFLFQGPATDHAAVMKSLELFGEGSAAADAGADV